MWQRIRNRLLLAAVLGAGLLAATVFGVGFLLAGGFLSLAAEVGAAQAALIVGGAVLAAIALALVMVMRPGRPSRRAATAAVDSGDGQALTQAGVRIAQALSANQRQAAMLALVIGIVLAISPKAREMVRQLAPATAPE